MGWLILCVNLTVPQGAQIVDKTSLLGMSGRVFPEEIRISIGREKNEDYPHLCSGHHPVC